MAENYARENNKASGKSCKNCRNSSGENGMNCKTPMSKQNAAQRKTEDCDR
ncbi:MAG: hypothetical protein IKU42_07940 [Oscillospiraceae bacterium]|nr:hypothetical protein [Oscillospiraceae bacterium]